MDLALHPDFAQNRIIYFTYSQPGERGDTTVLASARFDGTTLTDVRDLFIADAWSSDGGSSGSRIAFGLDRTLYMTVGERHEQTPAQDLRTHKGKILRLNHDGTVPPDNPFVDRADARPEIFAYGVRTPRSYKYALDSILRLAYYLAWLGMSSLPTSSERGGTTSPPTNRNRSTSASGC